jgi:hypothetical protein
MDISRRAWRADMQVEDENRTITGIAVPFDSETQIAERGRVFTERFAPGAFDASIAKRGNRIPVLLMHDDRALPIGKPVGFRSTADGLIMDARISDTTDGNDALTLVRDGVLSGLSVGFSVPDGGETWTDTSTRVITRANLHEVSVVNFPAYDDARIQSVRAATRSDVTFGTITEQVESAVEMLIGADEVLTDVCVVDITDTWAVFEIEGAGETIWDGMWKTEYAIGPDGVTLTPPIAVAKAYVPATVAPSRMIGDMLRLWNRR